MKLHARKRSSNERGSILVWVALFMIFMLAFVALGIDGAKLMATRTQLQNAADAGALAGASQVDPASGVIDQARATPMAQATAANNKAFIGGPKPVLDAVVSFPEASQCRVDVTRSGSTAIVTHIAQVVGVRTLNAEATATAELSKPTSVCGPRPFGVRGETDPFTYIQGQEYALTEGITPSCYRHLDFSQMLDSTLTPLPACTKGPCAGLPSTGGALLRCMIISGFGCCAKEPAFIRVQTGVATGNVVQGVDALFDDYGDITTEYPESQTDAYPVYLADGGNDSRVIVVPLVQQYSYSPTDPSPCSGNNCWGKVNGFAAFFLKRRFSSGERKFYGEFIEHSVSGGGSGGDGTVYSIKLIK